MVIASNLYNKQTDDKNIIITVLTTCCHITPAKLNNNIYNVNILLNVLQYLYAIQMVYCLQQIGTIFTIEMAIR